MLLISRIDDDGKRIFQTGEATTQHPLSSYGQPVLVLTNGDVLDGFAWGLGGWRLERCGELDISNISRLGFVDLRGIVLVMTREGMKWTRIESMQLFGEVDR
jgi:hypothetical protein